MLKRLRRGDAKRRRAEPEAGAPAALPLSCLDCVNRLTGRCPVWPLGAL